MTHIQRMERPISIALTDGDWCVIQGLLTKERNSVKNECFDAEHEGRKSYIDTLERLRQTIIRNTE